MMVEEIAKRKSFGAKAICYPMPVFIIPIFSMCLSAFVSNIVLSLIKEPPKTTQRPCRGGYRYPPGCVF